MTRKEILQMLALLKAAYPNFYRDMGKEELENIVNLWQSMFDEPAKLVAAAVRALIATDIKGFPPHIGAVKEQIRRLTNPDEMTATEAWGLVADVVKKYGSYGSDEGFAQLPSLIRSIVRTPGQIAKWGRMEEESFNTVVAANFQRSYRQALEKQQYYAKVPEDIKRLINDPQKLIGDTEGKHMIGDGGGKET